MKKRAMLIEEVAKRKANKDKDIIKGKEQMAPIACKELAKVAKKNTMVIQVDLNHRKVECYHIK